MAGSVEHIDVLIVGAGPSGLMLAGQLLRYGVQPMIIDRRHGPDKASKAVVLNARSLEIFRQMGMAEELTAEGVPCDQIVIRGKKPTPIECSPADFSNTPFPYFLCIPQNKVEKALLTRLTQNTCPVSWATEMHSLHQDDHSARVVLNHEGIHRTVVCRWVVAADGTESSVRTALGIAVDRDKRQNAFFVADIQVGNALNHSIQLISTPKDGVLGLFPLAANGRYRLLCSLPKEWEGPASGQVSYPEVKQHIDNILGFTLPVSVCSWTAIYIGRRHRASQLARQRCFLIGDAAHTYGPIAAIGMNSGLQDAANLGWKLASVLTGKTSPQLLNSYGQERLTAASAVEPVDRFLNNLTATPLVCQPFNWFIDSGLSRVPGRRGRAGRLFDRLSQLGTSYRQSHIAVHHATSRTVRAGDRLPFYEVYDEKSQTKTDLHRWTEKAGFIFLVLGTVSHHQLHLIGRWMKQKYPRGMHLYYLPYSPRNQQLFKAFELPASGTRMMLIRPDMYIAYINDVLNVNLIDTYMEEVIGWKHFGNQRENT